MLGAARWSALVVIVLFTAATLLPRHAHLSEVVVAPPPLSSSTGANSQVLFTRDQVLRRTPSIVAHGHTKPCPSCITPVPSSEQEKQTIDKLRIDAIKAQILSKLGLREKPEINGSAIPRDMVFEALRRAEPTVRSQSRSITGHPHRQRRVDDYFGRTSEVFMFAESGGVLNGQTILQFSHIHDSPETLRVKKATLWLSFKFKSVISKQKKLAFHSKKKALSVFAIDEGTVKKHKDKLKSPGGLNIPTYRLSKHLKLLATRKLRLRHMGWKRLNITKAIGQWFARNSTEKLHLFVDCTGCGTIIETKAEFGLTNSASDNYVRRKRRRRRRRNHKRRKPFRPFVVIETEALAGRRVRKRAVDCDGSTTRCCKQTLYVDFEQLKWDDWIISPRGYYANYCMGSCSHKSLSLDSYINYHSYVMEEYRIHNPYASIKPCCAPRKLSPISLIYFDKEYNIIKTDLRDMSVDECGCT